MLREEEFIGADVATKAVFVTDLERLEYLGSGNFLCIFVQESRSESGEITRREVVSSVIAPADAIRRAIFKAAKAIGLRLVADIYGSQRH